MNPARKDFSDGALHERTSLNIILANISSGAPEILIDQAIQHIDSRQAIIATAIIAIANLVRNP